MITSLNLKVMPGQIVALVGPNGAGKSTTVRTLAGVLKPSTGTIHLDGRETREPLHRRARRGLAYMSEERSVFMKMTVAENLRIARADPAAAFALFPELGEIRNRSVGLCSGGEQQMVALARVLVRRQSVMLVDELSLGLAPLVVDRLLGAVRKAADGGIGVLLVEQHIHKAVAVADHVYVLKRGSVVMDGPAVDMRGRIEEIESVYLS
ncbi:ABC transporter ATP-binding protein [Pseudonocardia ailaonensis]|uniref:ABC transporter ATP-binding protein n=1 Tax=Pseudonocardia ailaonensis TaxID=367279 RepID=UPI0031D2450A